MGENFCSVQEFVFALTQAESEHLKAFVNFVSNHKTMLDALRNKKWASFAEAYNGPGYKMNNYDKKLEEAYNSYKTEQNSAAESKP